MNFNNTENFLNLLICLFIVIYHSFTFLNLPNNIIHILRNPIVILVLLLILSFVVKNKTLILLLIILYFVIIFKSETRANITKNEIETDSDLDQDDNNEIETDSDIEQDDNMFDDNNEIETDSDFVQDDNVSYNNNEIETDSDFVQDDNVSYDNNENKQNENKQNVKDIYTLLNNNVSGELSNYEKVSDINQNKNIISNVSQTQLDTIQGEDYNHCK